MLHIEERNWGRGYTRGEGESERDISRVRNTTGCKVFNICRKFKVFPGVRLH